MTYPFTDNLPADGEQRIGSERSTTPAATISPGEPFNLAARMAIDAENQTRPAAPTPPLFNVPNQLTAARLLLSIGLFILLGIAENLAGPARANVYWGALAVFIVAASTDWLDGYWARKYGQVTTLGRIFDPFVDKIIICGAFIFLAAIPGSEIKAWMATVVVGRELLVTALRGIVEQLGVDFSAKMAGKLKMVLQCIAAGASMFALAYSAVDARPEWLHLTLLISVWASIVLTVYSGIGYVFSAAAVLRR